MESLLLRLSIWSIFNHCSEISHFALLVSSLRSLRNFPRASSLRLRQELNVHPDCLCEACYSLSIAGISAWAPCCLYSAALSSHSHAQAPCGCRRPLTARAHINPPIILFSLLSSQPSVSSDWSASLLCLRSVLPGTAGTQVWHMKR